MATNKLQEKLPEVAGGGGQYCQLVPALVPLAVTASAIAAASATSITLNAATSLIEVNVTNATSLLGVFMRYQASASSAAFDEYVMPGTRHYVRPASITVISFRADGADTAVRVIEK